MTHFLILAQGQPLVLNQTVKKNYLGGISASGGEAIHKHLLKVGNQTILEHNVEMLFSVEKQPTVTIITHPGTTDGLSLPPGVTVMSLPITRGSTVLGAMAQLRTEYLVQEYGETAFFMLGDVLWSRTDIRGPLASRSPLVFVGSLDRGIFGVVAAEPEAGLDKAIRKFVQSESRCKRDLNMLYAWMNGLPLSRGVSQERPNLFPALGFTDDIDSEDEIRTRLPVLERAAREEDAVYANSMTSKRTKAATTPEEEKPDERVTEDSGGSTPAPKATRRRTRRDSQNMVGQ
jgi:hypothetical protein